MRACGAPCVRCGSHLAYSGALDDVKSAEEREADRLAISERDRLMHILAPKSR